MRSQAPSPPDAARCQALTALRLPDLRVSSAEHVEANGSAAGQVHAAHCHVSGTIGSEIGFGLWLPDGWNGRFLMTGGGGFVGAVPPPGSGVDQGFAVTSTDTGHQSTVRTRGGRWTISSGSSISAISPRTGRKKPPGRSSASTTGRDPHHSYFYGCSTGGRQALMEAQRFPNDFDGIVSGAPVYNWTQALAAAIRNAQAMFPDPTAIQTPLVTADNLRLVQQAALDACDAKDGVRDGVIDDPRACAFDLAAQACEGTAAPDCLTDAQRAAIARVYAPLRERTASSTRGSRSAGKRKPAAWEHVGHRLQPRTRGCVRRARTSRGGSARSSSSISCSRIRTGLRAATTSPRTGGATREARVVPGRRQSRPGRLPRAQAASCSCGTGGRTRRSIRSRPSATTIASSRRIPAPRRTSGCSCCPACCTAAGGPGPDQVDRLAAMVDWVEKGAGADASRRRQAHWRGRRPHASGLRLSGPRRLQGIGSTDEAANFTCQR